jgi:hypothetical protein
VGVGGVQVQGRASCFLMRQIANDDQGIREKTRGYAYTYLSSNTLSSIEVHNKIHGITSGK